MKTLQEMNPRLAMLKQYDDNIAKPDYCTSIITPTISDEEVINLSKSAQSNYFCVFSKIPNIVYYLNSINLPSTNNRKIIINMPKDSTMFHVAGHGSDNDDFMLEFLMDEDFRSYFTMLKWLRDNQYKENFVETESNMSIIVLNNSKMPLLRIDFRDCIPTNIGEVQFQNMSADTQIWTATMSYYAYSVTYLDGSGFTIPYYQNPSKR